MAGDRHPGGALPGKDAGGALPGKDAGGALPGQGAGGAPPGPAAVSAPGRSWGRYDDARTAIVRDTLRAVISALVVEAGRDRLDILDAGGGTGGFAVPLAGLGHNVTVIDPSPDSLAAAERRAAEMDVPLTGHWPAGSTTPGGCSPGSAAHPASRTGPGESPGWPGHGGSPWPRS